MLFVARLIILTVATSILVDAAPIPQRRARAVSARSPQKPEEQLASILLSMLRGKSSTSSSASSTSASSVSITVTSSSVSLTSLGAASSSSVASSLSASSSTLPVAKASVSSVSSVSPSPPSSTSILVSASSSFTPIFLPSVTGSMTILPVITVPVSSSTSSSQSSSTTTSPVVVVPISLSLTSSSQSTTTTAPVVSAPVSSSSTTSSQSSTTPAAPAPTVCKSQKKNRSFRFNNKFAHKDPRNKIRLFHAVQDDDVSINGLKAGAKMDPAGDFPLPAFYLTDAKNAAAQFACYTGTQKEGVAIFEYEWKPAGMSVFEFMSPNSMWRAFVERKRINRRMFNRDMIAGPLKYRPEITADYWQYAVTSSCGMKHLRLKKIIRGMKCKDVPRGNLC